MGSKAVSSHWSANFYTFEKKCGSACLSNKRKVYWEIGTNCEEIRIWILICIILNKKLSQRSQEIVSKIDFKNNAPKFQANCPKTVSKIDHNIVLEITTKPWQLSRKLSLKLILKLSGKISGQWGNIMSQECQLLHFWGEMLIGLFINVEKYLYWPKMFFKIISDISYNCLQKIPKNWPRSFHQIFPKIAAKIVPKLDLEVFMSKSLTTSPPFFLHNILSTTDVSFFPANLTT